MLNTYFDTVEQLWKQAEPIKVKHTGDEILAVFATAKEAFQAVFQLNSDQSSSTDVDHLTRHIIVL